MKALKLIREDGYENVHYASLGEQKFKTLVVADRKDEQEQWFEQPEIECVPEEVSDIIRNYTLPYIDLGNTEDEYLLEQATNKVVCVVVENVLETQPFIPRNRNGRPIGEGVAFCDMLVGRIQNGELAGTAVYIKQTESGFRQPKDFFKMVGRIFPCKLTEIHIQTIDNYKLTINNPSNYVVEGSIELAEWLTNYQLLQQIEKSKDNSSRNRDRKNILERTHEGIVSAVINNGSNAGIMVMTKKLQTVFIPKHRVSYECDSSFVNLDEVVSVFDRVEFKITGANTQKPSPNQRERHIIHDYIRIEGDMKVLEEAPQDALIEMIDNKKVIGRLFKVRFISFDPQSLHTVELVDFPGIKIKMKDSGSLNRVPFKQGDEISVVILDAHYRWVDANSRGRRVAKKTEEVSSNSHNTEEKKCLFRIKSRFNSFYPNRVNSKILSTFFTS